MQKSLRNLSGLSVYSTERRVGEVSHVLFDDRAWAIRFIDVALDGAEGGRHVLVPPSMVEAVDERSRQMMLRVTSSEVSKFRDSDSLLPVNRKKEAELSHYSSGLSGIVHIDDIPPFLDNDADERSTKKGRPADVAWRRSREVLRYRLWTKDRISGNLVDFAFDDRDWLIREIEVSTRVGFVRRKALVSPSWVARVSWREHEVLMRLLAAALHAAPGDGAPEEPKKSYEAWLLSRYSLSLQGAGPGL